MNLPEELEILIITLSDRASRGEYNDMSGPAAGARISEFLSSQSWRYRVTYKLIPDDADIFRDLLKEAGGKYNIIFTTGGTGIGPGDITMETVKPLLSKEIPGIMEFIRIKYGSLKPNALLSRGIAGLLDKAVIYTLPGSRKAVEEYMDEILKTILHTIYMQYGIDTHTKY